MFSRRRFLAAPSLLAASSDSGIRREVFVASPGKGTAVMAYAFYTERRGGRMISLEQRWTRSDTIDVAYQRLSSDHGRTWTVPKEIRTGERTQHSKKRAKSSQ